MHCVFIVQASEAMGVGHLMRCLAVAQVLEYRQFQATFLLDEASASIAASRHDWHSNIIIHDYDKPTCDQVCEFIALKLPQVDWLIVDGYQFDYDYCHAWLNTGLKLALFDDGIHSSPFAATVLINAASSQQTASDNTPMLSGSQYRTLRREFVEAEYQSVNQRESLTLSFGGSDPANITLPLLKKLTTHNTIAPIQVVTGQAYPFLVELTDWLAATQSNVHHIHNAQDMAVVWSKSKLAVSAAGGSQFELAVCATPSILVVVAENQISSTQLAEKEGWCRVVNMVDPDNRETDFEYLLDIIQSLWNDERTLVDMQQSIAGQYDAYGAERLLEALAAYEA